MRNKRLYATVVLLTVSVLLFTGCGNKPEPLSEEPVKEESVIEEPEKEEEDTSGQTAGTGDTSGTVIEAETPVEETESDEESNVGGAYFDEDEADTQALINEVTKEVVQEILENEGVDTSDTSTDTTDTGDTSTTGNTSTGGTTGTGEVVEDNSYDENSVDFGEEGGMFTDMGIPEANPGVTYGDGTEYHWNIQ